MNAMATAEQHRVLVVDDEPNIVDVVSMALRFQGFSVESAGNGRDALAAVRAFDPHLMVLDIMLPDMEGFEVAERLGAQRATLPIIFLTARDATQDKIRGLTSGGDDYVTKPFSLEELVARIRVILRRTGAASPSSSRLTFEDLELDEDTREVTRAGQPIELTATEYRLLRYLLLNPRRVLTRAQLLDHVWEYDFDGDSRILETYVSYLRKKLDPHGPSLIQTVRGVGYALRLPARLTMSLRARLIIGLVALAAAGLVLAAAITYAEQRSLLYDQADEQATGAVRDVRRQLDIRNGTTPGPPLGRPAGSKNPRGGFPIGTPGAPGDGRPGPGPGGRDDKLAPAGTYGVDRDANGKDVGKPVVLGVDDGTAPSPPSLPDDLKPGDRLTVGSTPDGANYRVYAGERAGGGMTIVAVPFTQAVDTLDSLLLVQALVIGGVLLALALAAWWIVRLGLRPLTRIGETAGAIAAATWRAASSPPSRAPRSGAWGSR